ncbi:hypothetical protein [Nocardioides limicola]|uniref:hypothetical protein n=1 Tax=Nocardioides limicola TaxID=2803368 RepID=UPI00193B3C6B|nr:hypothetical protein [Nocardioides sp. DJM-14]
MRNWIGRLVAAVIATVLTLLAAPTTEAIALAPAESPWTYVYASHHRTALATGAATECGPPATHDCATNDADGLRSLGDLARPNGPTTPATYDYNDFDHRAQIARRCTLAEDRADGVPRALAVVQRSVVCRNTGNDLTRLYRAVDAAELKDIVGTGVYRSAPGGTEGKYVFPEQAENFSDLMGKTGTGPYCITSGCIPRSTLNGIETIHPAGEGTAYFIPQNLLPQFRDIIIHGP